MYLLFLSFPSVPLYFSLIFVINYPRRYPASEDVHQLHQEYAYPNQLQKDKDGKCIFHSPGEWIDADSSEFRGDESRNEGYTGEYAEDLDTRQQGCRYD